MEREVLEEWIRLGPIRITMNSGDMLVRCEDGKYCHHDDSLGTMSKVEQLEPGS